MPRICKPSPSAIAKSLSSLLPKTLWRCGSSTAQSRMPMSRRVPRLSSSMYAIQPLTPQQRRTARRPPPVVPATASAPKPSKSTAPPPVKQEKPDTPVPAPQAATSSRRTTAAAATKTAPPKRESSSLFKSFAKAKPPKPANETPAEPSSAQTPAADDGESTFFPSQPLSASANMPQNS